MADKLADMALGTERLANLGERTTLAARFDELMRGDFSDPNLRVVED